MIQFEKFTMDNNLRVIVHRDTSTPMIAFNVLYDVGARDEQEDKTGFAHLFEHLMFGGSVNIPDYDTPLQMAGGDNNAYTTNDFTNYYIQVPKDNMETAFYLESDRMLSLAFDENSLEVQRKVVCEEFKEHYINKPYGDAWANIRALAYEVHPYKWMTIGKELKHIEEAQLEDVKAFFKKHYNPSNAIVCVAGDVTMEEVKTLMNKWFGDIPAGERYVRQLSKEPTQSSPRFKEVIANVPLDALYKVWHIGNRLSDSYHAADLITEILGNGQASWLYVQLVKEKKIFSSISCYHTGSLDEGLLVIEGKISEGKTLEEGNQEVLNVINQLLEHGVSEMELSKAKNKIESMLEFEDMSLLSRANNLAFYELIGDASMINSELEKYENVSADQIKEAAQKIFSENNSSTIFYRKQNQ